MKIKFFLSLCCCITASYSFAFSDSTITAKELKNLIGCWEGRITYLDYSSNKPFSMPAELLVPVFGNSRKIACSQLYPKEPSANTIDTILISEDGRMLNKDRILQKTRFGKDSLVVITEMPGIDGNDNKPALIRHTYRLGKNSYAVKKEVLFTGQSQWIMRNEYSYRRKPCNH